MTITSVRSLQDDYFGIYTTNLVKAVAISHFIRFEKQFVNKIQPFQIQAIFYGALRNSACGLFALKIFKFPIYSASRAYLHKYTRFVRKCISRWKGDEEIDIIRRMPWHQMRSNTSSIIHPVDFKIHLISPRLFSYVTQALLW